MNISPAIIIDVALIAVIVVSVFHYARKGFVAGLMDLVGNLASLALAWVVSGKLSPTVFENFFKSGLIEQTARTIQQQGGVNLSVILDGLSGILPQKFIDDITASAAGLMDLVGNLASLALAWVVSGKLSPTVFENFFKSGLIEQTARTIQQQGGVNLSVILDGLSGILPQKFIDDITASAAGMLDSGAPDIAQQVVEKIIAPLVVPLITVVVFFATFVLCRVVIAFLVTVLTNINKIPLLGGVNRILGVCIGVVAGFINVLLILCLLWAVVVITNGNLPFVNDSSLSGSYFYSFFSAYNPFL